MQKKASGTATPEAARPASRRGLRPAVALRAVLVLGSLRSPAGKKASTAHFDGGARNVARSIVGEITPTFVRARAHSYPLSKRARLFPSAAYRRSAPPQLAWGILTSCGLKGFLRLGCFATQKREACASPQWTAGRLTHCGAEYYRGNKGQRVFFCTLAFSASHEACRRMAV